MIADIDFRWVWEVYEYEYKTIYIFLVWQENNHDYYLSIIFLGWNLVYGA